MKFLPIGIGNLSLLAFLCLGMPNDLRGGATSARNRVPGSDNPVARFASRPPDVLIVNQALLPPVPFPPENPPLDAKRLLGKILFWDEQLSSDNTVACGTCHIPANAGADPRFARHPGADGLFHTDDDVFGSPGIVRRDANNDVMEDPLFGFDPQVTRRAAQSYFMAGYAAELFWDGRARSRFVDPLNPSITVIPFGGGLESQAVVPILSEVEMAHEGRDWPQVIAKLEAARPLALATDLPADVAEALAEGRTYSELFDAAFADPQITPARIAMAIATYERALVPNQAPWDRYMMGDTGAMTAQQITGWNILQHSTLCLNCHTPPLFTDNKFYNIGLRPSAEDVGRQEVTGEAADIGRFRTPSLRNVGLKVSLMHVGWITDVEDAVAFYNAPGVDDALPGWAGHVQFTQDQSGIPTSTPGVFADYELIHVPVEAAVIDFIANALTDPRVANEEFPFDRPTLRSEELSALASFVTCMTGPMPLPPTPLDAEACLDRFDDDLDQTVDLADFATLQSHGAR